MQERQQGNQFCIILGRSQFRPKNKRFSLEAIVPAIVPEEEVGNAKEHH